MKLSQHWIDQVVQQPETGIGYQRAIIHLNNGEAVEALIINSCTVVDLNIKNEDIKNIVCQRRS